MQFRDKLKRATAASAVAIITAAAFATPGDFNWIAAPAFAEDGGGQSSGQGNQEGQGQGSKGSPAGQSNKGGQGAGQGGPSEDSDSDAPHQGTPPDPKPGRGGSAPGWTAQVPEVELGRLNVARAPQSVLDRAYAEAIATLDVSPEMISFYSNTDIASLDALIRSSFDTISYIDSPLQNLALLQEAMTTDGSALYNEGVTGTSLDTLKAVFLAVASDKTVPISNATVEALAVIFNATDMTLAEIEKLQSEAEIIRLAISDAHG